MAETVLSPAAARIARTMRERGRGGLDDKVRAILAGLPQVKRYHTFDSRRSHEGFPDWVLCGPRGVMYRELKREGCDPTRAQQAWLDALTAAGQDAGTWRPSDLLSGRIARELAALAGFATAPAAPLAVCGCGAGLYPGRTHKCGQDRPLTTTGYLPGGEP